MHIPKISSPFLRSSFVIEFVVSLVAGISAVFWAFVFTSEVKTLDHRLQQRALPQKYIIKNQEKDPSLIVVYLQSGTLKDKKIQNNNLDITPRDYLAKVVHGISRGKPSVIALDYLFDEKDSKQNDLVLLKELQKSRKSGIKIVGGMKLIPVPYTGEKEARHFAEMGSTITDLYSEAFDSKGFFNLWKVTESDSDEKKSIVRFTIASLYDDYYSFPFQIYKEYYNKKNIGRNILRSNILSKRYIHFRNEYIEQGFHSIKSKDLLNILKSSQSNVFLEALFKNKVVIVGNADYKKDYHYTSINKSEGSYGVFIQASIVSNYIQNDFIKEVPFEAKILLWITMFFISIAIAYKKSVLKIIIYGALLISFYVLFVYMMFFLYVLWLPLISGVGIVFISILAVVLIRIAFSENDNILAEMHLSEYIAPELLSKMKNLNSQSVFLPQKGHAFILTGWTRNLPVNEKYDIKKINSFLDQYYNSVRKIVFDSGGCFNRLPQNGFIAFWPLEYFSDIEEVDLLKKVIETAILIKFDNLALNSLCHQIFFDCETLYVDIAISKDECFMGSFTNQENHIYTAVSSSLNDLLIVPWLFSHDRENSILIHETIKDDLSDDYSVEKIDGKYLEKKIYVLKNI